MSSVSFSKSPPPLPPHPPHTKQEKRLNQAFDPRSKETNKPTTRRQTRSSKPKLVVTLENSNHTPPDESLEPCEQLPECFDSDYSDGEEFWGFPPEVVVNEIQSQFNIEFELNEKGRQLFGDHDSSDADENFGGFTLQDLWV